MEDHLILPMTIDQFLNDQRISIRRTEATGVRILKIYNALEAIQLAAEATRDHCQIDLYTPAELGRFWYAAFRYCDEISETVSYGYTVDETNSMVNSMREMSLKQTNELIRLLNRTSRKAQEMFEALGYLVM
ncbi:MAG: hypothetical protein WBG42_10665 [Cryomorphaceae bacterium]